MTPDSAAILHDLDLLDDWLAGKGYGEEAGLVLRAMVLINAQARELRKLRASKHDLEDARELRALRVENETLRAALKPFAESGEQVKEYMRITGVSDGQCNDTKFTFAVLVAAAAALKEAEDE